MRVWFGSLAAQNKKRKFHTEIAKNAKGRRAWTCPEGHEDKGFLEWFFVPEGHMTVARRFIAGSVITPACVPEDARIPPMRRSRGSAFAKFSLEDTPLTHARFLGQMVSECLTQTPQEGADP